MLLETKKTNMAEENEQSPTLNTDDLETLRILLHSVKGISAVSTVAEYIPVDDTLDE